jgi:hypothetical protein
MLINSADRVSFQEPLHPAAVDTPAAAFVVYYCSTYYKDVRVVLWTSESWFSRLRGHPEGPIAVSQMHDGQGEDHRRSSLR